MHAIQVNHIPVSGTTDEYLVAWDKENSVSTVFDSSKTISQNIRNAMVEFGKKMELTGAWLGCILPTDDYAFICIDPDSDFIVGMYNR